MGQTKAVWNSSSPAPWADRRLSVLKISQTLLSPNTSLKTYNKYATTTSFMALTMVTECNHLCGLQVPRVWKKHSYQLEIQGYMPEKKSLYDCVWNFWSFNLFFFTYSIFLHENSTLGEDRKELGREQRKWGRRDATHLIPKSLHLCSSSTTQCERSWRGSLELEVLDAHTKTEPK